MYSYLSRDSEELRKGFHSLRAFADLCALLEMDRRSLAFLLYGISESQKYRTFKIKKSDGTDRRIDAPSGPMLGLQRKLNQVLTAVYKPNPVVMGFVAGGGVVQNAKKHVQKKYVFNADLKDFFPTIHLGRVIGLFKSRPYSLPSKIATVLAQICCFERALPQGAPTSPVVSNMICARMDGEVRRLALRNGCTYTRYADDMTFSTRRRRFPSAIAKSGVGGSLTVGVELDDIVSSNWFEFNPSKIYFRSSTERQVVTGLTVNEFPNVTRKFLNQIRAMLHAWKVYGHDRAQDEYRARYSSRQTCPTNDEPLFSRVVRGKIEYVGMVRGKTDRTYLRLGATMQDIQPGSFPPPPSRMSELRRDYQVLLATTDFRDRGLKLEGLLQDLFDAQSLKMRSPFTRSNGAQQIDGAFSLDGWFFVVECRWRKKKAGIREVDGLYGAIDRSGAQTLGIYLSMSGWSKHVPSELMKNSRKNIVLMNAEDLECLLDEKISVREMLGAKLEHLNPRGEPYCPAEEYLTR
jgi:RNA-directed DNA polymerase